VLFVLLLVAGVVSFAVSVDSGIGSGSRGAGGGVVSIVQPIQPAMTRTSSTKSRTGMPMAHALR